MWTALCAYEESVVVRGKALDFPDSLIVAKSHAVLRRQVNQYLSYSALIKWSISW